MSLSQAKSEVEDSLLTKSYETKLVTASEHHQKEREEMLHRITMLENEKKRAIGMWKEADKRLINGVG